MFSINPSFTSLFIRKNSQKQGLSGQPSLKPLDRDVVSISSKPQKQGKPLESYTKNNTKVSDELIQYRQFDLLAFKNYFAKESLKCGWKIHVYADNEQDMINLQNTVGQYLIDNDTTWKTTIDYPRLEEFSDKQKGKALVIYPKNVEDFKKIAKDIDYIIRNNKLEIQDTDISGDRKLGDTGRLFYRYDYNSGKYKDKVFDLDNESDEYDKIYERNRENNKYLAFDMTEDDDPFLNFNPSLIQIDNRDVSKLENCYVEGNKYKLQKKEIFPLQSNTVTIYESQDHQSDCTINVLTNARIRFMQNGDTLTIGRAEDNDIVIGQNNARVSRYHAKIYKADNKLYIEDISMNGTMIDK